MKYRREWPIGETTYTLKFVSPRTMLRVSGKSTNRGACSHADETIYILRGQTQEWKLRTLIHELAHAVEFEYGIKIPHWLIYKLEAPLARLWMALCGSRGW